MAVRGSADSIMALSNVPLTRPLALPIPTDRTALDVLVTMVKATRTGELKVHRNDWKLRRPFALDPGDERQRLSRAGAPLDSHLPRALVAFRAPEGGEKAAVNLLLSS